jgi:putative acetyltransferase
MRNGIIIRPIQPEEAVAAKRLIYTVAHPLMEPQMALSELVARWGAQGVFCDLDDVQKSYFTNGGVFLVMVDGQQIIGTGAFQRHAEGVCEVRRVFLLPEYQGQGLGYAMMMELIRLAREMGYGKMNLWTYPHKLTRAVAVYHQLGFANVRPEGMNENSPNIAMELTL